MHVQEVVGADVQVSMETLAQEGAEQAVLHRIRWAVIREADKSAWKVRPESVACWRGKADEGARTVAFHGVWCPKEARLVGGEYDGATIGLTPSREGQVPARITLPYRSSPNFSTDTEPRPTAHPIYKRSGIDPVEDIWVYTHVV